MQGFSRQNDVTKLKEHRGTHKCKHPTNWRIDIGLTQSNQAQPEQEGYYPNHEVVSGVIIYAGFPAVTIKTLLSLNRYHPSFS